MRSVAASALVALALLAAGCGGSDEDSSGTTTAATTTEAETGTETTSTAAGATAVGLYFLRDDRLGYALRTVPATPKVATAALEQLFAGPNEPEREAGLSSDVPPNTELESLTIEDGLARVELSNSLDEPAKAQVVFTLTRYPTVQRVELEGATHTREDYEQVAPAILVEQPAPGTTVSSPLRISGSANTFEATFMVDLVSAQGGKPLVHDFVTATSGSGTRGTFEESLDFLVDRERPGKLVVYESSAEDGSVMNRVEIPLVLLP
jgi:Immunoglobulin-like domain of bacterial spore germination/Sporulation and spore germination